MKRVYAVYFTAALGVEVKAEDEAEARLLATQRANEIADEYDNMTMTESDWIVIHQDSITRVEELDYAEEHA